jgi:RHS repeat-associated protein
MRGKIRNNTSQFQLAISSILQYHYHCDALGSPRKVTNENGIVRWQTRYYPFGEMFQTQGSGNTHTFTGKEWDAEMDLNYFCQRYYDPEIGRFMALDPIRRSASSPYAYCANNPLKFIDPTGAVMMMDIDLEHPGGAQSPDYYGMGWHKYNTWTARAADMDPIAWPSGWWMTKWDKIRAAIAYLGRTEWAQGAGKEIIAMLNYLIATGRIFLDHEAIPFHMKPYLNCITASTGEVIGIQVGWLFLSEHYSIEELALGLVHESAHALHNSRISVYATTPEIRDANAVLFEASFFYSMGWHDNDISDPIGIFSSMPLISSWWQTIVNTYPSNLWAPKLGEWYRNW